MSRGGHDPEKVYAAYHAAVNHRGSPTVIFAATVKGYGLGEAGEGRNITHQQKKLNEDELAEFRTRFGIPISDDDVADAPFYRPPDDSRSIRIRSSLIAKRRTGSSWRKALPRRGRCRHSSRPARPTPRTASQPFPSSSITRCSDFSASAT